MRELRGASIVEAHLIVQLRVGYHPLRRRNAHPIPEGFHVIAFLEFNDEEVLLPRNDIGDLALLIVLSVFENRGKFPFGEAGDLAGLVLIPSGQSFHAGASHDFLENVLVIPAKKPALVIRQAISDGRLNAGEGLEGDGHLLIAKGFGSRVRPIALVDHVVFVPYDQRGTEAPVRLDQGRQGLNVGGPQFLRVVYAAVCLGPREHRVDVHPFRP